MPNPISLPESIFAGRLMTMMAGRVTEGLSTFSSWLVGSFVAVFAFLLGHLDTVSKFIPAATLGLAGKVFLGAVVLHVIQRYLAVIVSGAVAVGRDVQDLPIDDDLNLVAVFEQVSSSTFWPARILVRKSFAKGQSGDYATSGRMLAALAQVQGLLVVCQLVVVLFATYLIVGAL